MSRDNDFQIWKTVLESVDCIDELNSQRLISKKVLSEFLEGLEARTQLDSDPVDDLELFVLRRLCRSIRNSLEQF